VCGKTPAFETTVDRMSAGETHFFRVHMPISTPGVANQELSDAMAISHDATN